MKISLIISTYNNPEALQVVFAGLARQTRMPDEVVIADDGSADQTRDVVDRCRELLGIDMLHVWQPDNGFRLSQIRNKAIAASTGDYIIQIDGDIVMHPQFIADHERRAQNGTFSCGKRVLLGKSATAHILQSVGTTANLNSLSLEQTIRSISRLSPITPDIRNRKNAIHSPLIGWMFRLLDKGKVRHRGCNMAYWRSDAIAINGFDEAFKGWGLEDTDFFERLVKQGVRPKQLANEAIAFHLWHPSNEGNPTILASNQAILDASRTLKSAKATQGIDQYLPIAPTSEK